LGILAQLQGDYGTARGRYEESLEISKQLGDQAGIAKARDDFVKAHMDAQAVEQAAGEEQIEDECRALFITVDNGDLFGYPGGGNAWMKENIKGMVGELSKIRRDFNLPWGSPPGTGALCNCFKKIRDWVNGQPVIKKNFDADIFQEKPSKVTWSEAISRLTDKYCQYQLHLTWALQITLFAQTRRTSQSRKC
jgi:hypothetical protein